MTLTKDIIRLNDRSTKEAPKKKETKQNTEDKTHKNSEIFKKLSKTHFITPL